ncbi:2-methylcitrate dehydratase [Bordetella genomosp. 10]|uniref:2-methylcitrate dehydratase n=1 Tax=Bordetella genomosp. 10 TaxID=1416804 RepID=A0A261SLF6_9BORD|nr:MmgE/PrpD family protein [Bordetella genomosp. 10]OZI37153.1 2-methylcitrate dehydratase [Bordetella genomosp. 10]
MTTLPISLAFARNILAFSRRQLPEAAFVRARSAIIDTIGVTLAGSRHDGSAILRSVIEPTAAQGKSRVLGTDLRLNSLDAALLNGQAAHMLDYDDSNSYLHGHPSVAILPAALAVADEHGIDGQTLLQAYITGFEAVARLGSTVGRRQYTHGWHPTTTIGIFGAVAAAGVLLALNEAQLATALGIAASFAAGIKSNFGSMTKPLIVGHANRNALLAVLLAKNGHTAGAQAFEHPQGYFAVFNGGPDTYAPQFLTEDWDAEPRILDREKGVKQKRYPCCFALAPVLDGVLALRAEHDLRPDDIASVAIGVHAIRFPHINVPNPVDPLGGKFSTSYAVARALVQGAITMEDFEHESRFNDTATRALMPKVSLSVYERDNPSGATVVIRTNGGQVHERYVEAAVGTTHDLPLSAETLEQKFLNCAGRVLTPAAAEALLQRLEQDQYA